MSGQRCDLSDLLVTECACRLHSTPEPAYARGGSVTRFVARYDGHCEGCGRRTHAGDTIARTDVGDYICEECSA